jgi:hypothetical protein
MRNTQAEVYKLDHVTDDTICLSRTIVFTGHTMSEDLQGSEIPHRIKLNVHCIGYSRVALDAV